MHVPHDPVIGEIVEGKGELCRDILEALPAWFGIPEAREEYVREVEAMPMVAVHADGRAVGFVALKHHFEHTVEVFVMGVRPEHHRQGFGRRLIQAVERHALQNGQHIITVKTLSPARENEEYAQTRAFYSALGFVAVEEFPTLWGEANPCLFMAKVV